MRIGPIRRGQDSNLQSLDHEPKELTHSSTPLQLSYEHFLNLDEKKYTELDQSTKVWNFSTLCYQLSSLQSMTSVPTLPDGDRLNRAPLGAGFSKGESVTKSFLLLRDF